MADRGRDVSRALTEVRTVLSRAETAASMIDSYYRGSDPEAAEMVRELELIADRLERWRRTGRPKRTRR